VSYREENGQVVLTMNKEDFTSLMYFLGLGAALTHLPTRGVLELLNRLNQGNPHYTPYKV